MRLLFIILGIFTIASGFKINKCCPKEQIFSDIFMCTPGNVSSSWWKSRYEYGILPCTHKSVQLKMLPDYSVSDENGELTAYEDNNFNETYSLDAYCLEDVILDDQVERIAYACPCYKKLCIQKCCPPRKELLFSSKDHGNAIKCQLSSSENKWSLDKFLNGTEIRKDLHLMDSMPKCGSLLMDHLDDGYKILYNGSLETDKYGTIPAEFYCSDFALEDDIRKLKVLACVNSDYQVQKHLKYTIFGIAYLIGAFFLLLTSIIYIWLPEFRGLPGKSLVNHAISLMVGSVVCALGGLFLEPGKTFICRFVAFTAQFSFLAAFFWLNVMCVDIAWTFSGIRPPGGNPTERDRRKFISYSIFAWSGASLITLAAIIVDLAPQIPEDSVFKPNTGHSRCWFQSKESTLLYFYGPMGLLIFANIVLFVYTLWRIYQLKKGTGALRQTDSARHGSSKENTKNKERFVLYAKLFSLMGVTWIMEIVSWAVGGSPKLWYLTDMINALRGVFIFYIFCCKPKVWKALKKKIEWLRHLNCCRSSTVQGVTSDGMTSTTNDKTTKDDAVEMKPR